VHSIQTILAYTSQRNLEPFPERCQKLCPAATLLKYASKPTPESYKYASKSAPKSNKCFSRLFLSTFQYPPHNDMYNKENSNDMHTCVKVYCTYAYNITLLGSIAVVDLIGALILAHTHIHAFI